MFNRIVIFGSIIIIFIMIAIPTYSNVKKDHEEKVIIATKMKIIQSTKKCFIDGVCKGNSTTLKVLYDNKYLERQVNPITKEYYADDSIIKYENKIVVLDFI